jgi:hypothetical protein
MQKNKKHHRKRVVPPVLTRISLPTPGVYAEEINGSFNFTPQTLDITAFANQCTAQHIALIICDKGTITPISLPTLKKDATYTAYFRYKVAK